MKIIQRKQKFNIYATEQHLNHSNFRINKASMKCWMYTAHLLFDVANCWDQSRMLVYSILCHLAKEGETKEICSTCMQKFYYTIPQAAMKRSAFLSEKSVFGNCCTTWKWKMEISFSRNEQFENLKKITQDFDVKKMVACKSKIFYN